MLTSSLSQRQKGLLAAILTATCWSFLAIVLKVALLYADSYSIVWYRMFVAFSALSLWILSKKSVKPFKVLTQAPGLLLVASLCLAFNYVGFMQGVHYTSPANAQIFIQIGPLLLAIAGVLFFKERLSLKQSMGFLFCTAGFSLFFWDRQGAMNEHPTEFLTGFAWILMAAVTWALFASLQKKLFNFWSSHQINLYIYLVSTLLFLPFVDWQTLLNLPLWVHGLYIFLGMNTLLAYGSLSVALKNLPATQVSPIITMNPLLTLILLLIIEQMNWQIIPADPIHWKGYLGAVLAVIGVIFVVTKPVNKRSV